VKIQVMWDMTPRRLFSSYWRCGRLQCFQFLGKAVGCIETSENTNPSTQYHMPEELNLQATPMCETQTSYTVPSYDVPYLMYCLKKEMQRVFETVDIFRRVRTITKNDC